MSDILALLRPKTAVSAGLDAGGSWAIRFPSHAGIKFNAVMRGACWVRVEGQSEAVWIEAGDCFLLTRGRPFLFATDLALSPIDAAPIYEQAIDGIATCNGGGDFFLIGGRFAFDDGNAGLLFDALPPIVHLRDASSHAALLRGALDQLAIEIRSAAPGQALMTEHLAQIMLVQVLRLWLAEGAEQGPGWLRALGHQGLSRALSAMHARPGHPWTLAALAAEARMSRTIFSQRFHATVGRPPLAYLADWRMRLAADRLRRSSDSVAGIAFAVGYGSEAAFSTAFRRFAGTSPGRYRQQQSGS